MSNQAFEKFTVTSWKITLDGSFVVEYAVTNSAEEQYDSFEVTVPFQGEDPSVFFQKLQNYMVSHTSYLENLHKVQRQLGGYTFTSKSLT